MSKYKWDINELRMRKNALMEYYESKKDIEEYEDVCESIMQLIQNYEEMIGIASKKKTLNESFNDCLDKEETLLEMLSDTIYFYNDENAELLTTIMSSYLVIDKLHEYKKRVDTPVPISNERLVEIAEDFFDRMTTPAIAKSFENILNTDGVININYCPDNECYGGMTMVDSYTNAKFIHVSRTNYLSDIATLPHEAFHYIFTSKFAGKQWRYDTKFLTEVEGILSDILMGEYYFENGLIDKKYFRLEIQDRTAGHAETLVIRNTILDSLKENGKIRLSKLNKYLGHFSYHFDNEDQLKELLIFPCEGDITYLLSTLVALDLYYNTYLSDREKCFYLLKNIRYVAKENDIFTLLRNNEITFMDDDFKNLKKYLKK